MDADRIREIANECAAQINAECQRIVLDGLAGRDVPAPVRGGTTLIVNAITTALTEQAAAQARLLAWVLKDVVWQGASRWWFCRECGKPGVEKLDIQHLPTCILHGYDRATLAALDAAPAGHAAGEG